MNTPVKFEIAKLLKEKGIEFKTNMFYPDLSWNQDTLYNSLHTEGVDFCQELGLDAWGSVFPAPTIADVLMWLYENHDIWISLIPDSQSGHKLIMRKFSVHLFIYRNGLNVQNTTFRVNENIAYYNSPTKAYEAAIKYCLTEIVNHPQH